MLKAGIEIEPDPERYRKNEGRGSDTNGRLVWEREEESKVV
jgi:hypothetical protein